MSRLSTSKNSKQSPPRDATSFDRLVEGARDISRVSGLTHNFYKYPARFSPKFVRAVIEHFSEPGDLVLDPFMGGGTTIVEALALGRNAIGTDISSLAVFVAEVKTTLLDDTELDAIDRWALSVNSHINIHNQSVRSRIYADAGYYRHLNSTLTWRLRKAVEQALSMAINLGSARLEAFARCVVLRTAQWALDGRKKLPTVTEFRSALVDHAGKMVAGARALREAVAQHPSLPRPTIACLHRSAAGMENDILICERPRPTLVLTSPPYPGIHVLYHRWQVDGRKETPAPFWIANTLDGSGASYYTLGDRKAVGNSTYFERLQAALTSVALVCDETTTIVQVVAFSEPDRQLPRYLEINRLAGFQEISTPLITDQQNGRLWRTIPNRKWHAGQLGDIPASQEVVLFHRRVR